MRRFLLVLLLLALPAAAQQPGEPVPIRIDSKILGETRTVLVRTPPSYATGARTYPVLYMTDGETQLAHTAATADFLVRNGRMPEVIIVGITNTDRPRDLTPTRVERDSFDGNAVVFPTSGGAEKFLAFKANRQLDSHARVHVRVAKALSEKPRQQSSIDARIAELGGTLERNAAGTIVKIDLHETKVTAADLEILAAAPQLEHLDLRLTSIDDAAIDHIRSLERLTFLNLFRTAVGNDALAKMAGLRELRTLLIGGTRVTDEGLASLTLLPNLRKVSIFRTAVSDGGVAHLKQLPNLEVLLIGGSKITSAGQAELRQARPEIRFSEQT
ncbi:MAG TPA: alpha/beta hydrolase-fold protein [Thermoanaerobaculia bacterium]|nr:alpha/beta hydrolase-fold protein [Thermoanaerobaculia bacterium]